MSDTQQPPEADSVWIYGLLKLVGWVFLVLVVVFLLLAPVAFTWLLQSSGYSSRVVRLMGPIEFVQSILIHLLTMGWLFFFGGCLASFLNVVAWRVPRGKPITGSSQCPGCQTRLKFLDNMPFTGWLRNSGRCRQCGSRISIRYLVAEIVLGVIFLVLGSVVFLTGAANWPIEQALHPAGFAHLLFSLRWGVIVVLLWHLTLVCFLFTYMLIESDGLAAPISITATAIVIAILVTLFRPEVWLILWRQPLFLWQSGQLTRMDWFFNFATGGIVGFAVGKLNHWAIRSSAESCSTQVSGMTLVGIYLGWQAALAVGSIAMGAWLCCRLLMNRSVAARVLTPASCLLLATVLHLLLWSRFYSLRDTFFLVAAG